MLSQLSVPGLDQLLDTTTVGILVAAALVLLLLGMLSVMIWRFQGRFVRRWESVDKRLSEVLWRTRHSDAEELRKRTVILEEQLVDMLQYLRTVANTIDSQMEAMANEMKNSLGKIDRTDSKSVGQSRMVIYQLERIRKQLEMLEEAGASPRHTAGSSHRGGKRSVAKNLLSQVGEGYRVEAVPEPIRQKIHEAERSNAEVEGMLDELSWEKK
ncbi:MAG: hypothetical protein IID41_04545 [Planctomycetes bacterium]|nr:hypothetical protein [Planctomycetota bacterium]